MPEETDPMYPETPPSVGVPDDAGSDNFVDPELASAQMNPPKRSAGAKGGVLGAAMVALGHIIEPSKVSETVQAVAEADKDEEDPLAGFDFGGLPPIG